VILLVSRPQVGQIVRVVEGEEAAAEVAAFYLPDSWVLSVETDSTRVCFVLDAVLTPQHPRYYSPPKRGEQYAYSRVRWCLHGEVCWNDGPHLDRPAVDASGEHDFGNVDAWFQEADVDHLEGSWGTVAVRGAQHSIEYLDSA
jgi:hypothetical protein